CRAGRTRTPRAWARASGSSAMAGLRSGAASAPMAATSARAIRGCTSAWATTRLSTRCSSSGRAGGRRPGSIRAHVRCSHSGKEKDARGPKGSAENTTGRGAWNTPARACDFRPGLELQTHADAHDALGRPRAPDRVELVRSPGLEGQELGAGEGRVGAAPVRVVEHVLRLDADLRPEAAHGERAEQPHVHVPDAGSTELVAPAGAEPIVVEARRLREQRLVVPRHRGRAGRAVRVGIALHVDEHRAAA